ncbi:unnamed protein product, partial [Didymodactylos carnosus]
LTTTVASSSSSCSTSTLLLLPNELILFIFLYLQPTEIIEIFFNLSTRINNLIFSDKHVNEIDLTHVDQVWLDKYLSFIQPCTNKLKFKQKQLSILFEGEAQWTNYYNLNMESLLSDNTMKYLIICGEQPKARFRLYITNPELSATCTHNKGLDGHIFDTKKTATVEKCIIGAYRREFFVTFTAHPSYAHYETETPTFNVRAKIYLTLINYWSLIVENKPYNGALPQSLSTKKAY